MDERRQQILVVLVVFMTVRHVMAIVAISQKLVLCQHYAIITMVFAMMVAESSVSRRTHSIWVYDRSMIYADILLFGCYLIMLFKQHTRLLLEIFDYSCGVLLPSLSRKDTNFRTSNIFRYRIPLSMNKLSSGNSLRSGVETYRINESIASIILREFGSAIEKHLKPLLIEKQSKSTLKRIVVEFEELKGITLCQ